MVRWHIDGVTWVVLSWASLLLALVWQDRLAFFLHPGFRPLILVSGVVLGVMGVLLCWRPAPRGEVCESCGGGRSGFKWWKVLWWVVLVLPAWTAFYGAGEGYGAQAVFFRGVMDYPQARRAAPIVMSEILSLSASADETKTSYATDEGALEDEGFLSMVEKSDQGAWRLSLSDVVMANVDEGFARALSRGRVEVLGQKVEARNRNPRGDRFLLVRFMMVCCAADARPLGVMVKADQEATAIKDMSWVKIVGRVEPVFEEGRRFIVIQAEEISPSVAPKEWFLHY